MKEKKVYSEMTNEDLLEKYKKLIRSMGFFNAAEGQSWHREAAAREACNNECNVVGKEIKKRGLELPRGY